MRLFLNQIETLLVYKWNVLARFFVPLFQMLIALFVWQAIYKTQHHTISGYSLQKMSTYIVVSALISVLASIQHSYRLTQLVRSGNLSYVLVRPYHYTLESLATFLGNKVVEVMLFAILLVLLVSSRVITLAGLSLLSGILLLSNFVMLFFLVCCIGDLSFRLIQMWPLRPLFSSLANLLGGALFPLDVLPTSLYNILQWNPFALLFFVNTKLLLSSLPPDQLLRYLAASVGWMIMFGVIHVWLWKIGLRRYESMGV